MPKKLLILGGTHEAYNLAESLSKEFPSKKLIIVSSLSGATLNPKIPVGTLRIGGFGGFRGLKNYLEKETISLVINATHPYATQISENSYIASNELRIPYFRMSRPPWKRTVNDNWIDVPNIEAASNYLNDYKRLLTRNLSKKRVFLTIGTRDLHFFHKCKFCNFVIRTVDKPIENSFFTKAIYFQGRGPFSLETELELFRQNSIKMLITKNSGGTSSFAKIEASRELNIPVIMVARPSSNYSENYYSLTEAIEWVSNEITL